MDSFSCPAKSPLFTSRQEPAADSSPQAHTTDTSDSVTTTAEVPPPTTPVGGGPLLRRRARRRLGLPATGALGSDTLWEAGDFPPHDLYSLLPDVQSTFAGVRGRRHHRLRVQHADAGGPAGLRRRARTGLGDTLAEYWDGGGAVVMTAGAYADGRFTAGGYAPSDPLATVSSWTDSLGAAPEPDSPLMSRVGQLGTPDGFQGDWSASSPGAVVAATWAKSGNPPCRAGHPRRPAAGGPQHAALLQPPAPRALQ